MKKAVGISTGILTVLAAAWLGATWYTGKRIEAETPAHLAEVNQALADALGGVGFGLEIRQIEYQRHFFSSHARYAVSLTKTADAPEDLPEGAAEFVSHIQHGPFPTGALARGHWLPKLAFVHAELAANDDVKPLFELTKGATPFWSDTVVSYNGDSSGTAEIAPLELTKDGATISFSGARAQGEYTQATRSSVAQIDIERIAMDASQGDRPAKASAAGITMSMDSRQGQFGFGIGKSAAQVQRVDIEDLATDTKVALQGLGYTAHLGENGANLNLEMRYELGQIDVNGHNFGQGQAVIKLDRLDGKAMAELSELYNEIFTDIKNADTPSDALTTERRQTLLIAGRQVLAGNPSLQIAPVTWKTPKGESSLALTLDLTKPAALDAEQPQADDPHTLLRQGIKALNVKVVVSKPMAQDIIAQVLQAQGLEPQQAASEANEHIRSASGMAEMLGLGTNDGDNLLSTFEYAEGVATLNGNPVPFDELLGDLVGDMGEAAEAADSQLLDTLDPDLMGQILEQAGYAYETTVAPSGNPVIDVEPGSSGAASLRIEFNECDIDTSCSDLLMRATFAPERPVSLRTLNHWNVNSRWTRAFLNSDNQAVLEMDVNAYGGIGDQGADYLVGVFLRSVPEFADLIANPPR